MEVSHKIVLIVMRLMEISRNVTILIRSSHNSDKMVNWPSFFRISLGQDFTSIVFGVSRASSCLLILWGEREREILMLLIRYLIPSSKLVPYLILLSIANGNADDTTRDIARKIEARL